MTINQMRSALREVYSGPRWMARVDEMDDRQVVAVYYGMKQEGRLVQHKPIKKPEPGIEKAEQLNIWNYEKYEKAAT